MIIGCGRLHRHWGVRRCDAISVPTMPNGLIPFNFPSKSVKTNRFLVGDFKHFLFSIIYGIILPIDFHIFQDAYCTTNQIWLMCNDGMRIPSHPSIESMSLCHPFLLRRIPGCRQHFNRLGFAGMVKIMAGPAGSDSYAGSWDVRDWKLRL